MHGGHVTVGVSGHRILAELNRVETGVDYALDLIQRTYLCEAIEVMSSLAEGADQLVARRVLARRGGQLTAVLPLPLADYERDFDSEVQRCELHALLNQAGDIVELSGGQPRDAAYEAAGLYILERSDVLLAVWDGMAEQGRGGTGDIVATARALLRPLVIVQAGNRRPGTNEPTTLGAAQGHVVVERLPEP